MPELNDEIVPLRITSGGLSSILRTHFWVSRVCLI